MAMIGDGEPTALEVIFDRHAGAAFSLAFRMCGQRVLAEDIVQEAVISVWRCGGNHDRARGSVRSWVLSVVHSRAIDAFRRDAIRTSRDVSDDEVAKSLSAPGRTDEEVERRDEARQVRSALDALPPEQRHVIELAYFGGFTRTQIAAMLDVPVGTVKGRMRLGLTKLRIGLGAPAEDLI